MKILVIGGTRFVGKWTAIELAREHEVTVLSRNAQEVLGTQRIVADRTAGLMSLRHRTFDAVLDFIAYDPSNIVDACALGQSYIGISSAWLPRLCSAKADEVVAEDASAAPRSMLPITRRYLLGKAMLERTIAECRAKGRAAATVRLPIMMGVGDHTGRTDFYRNRVVDGGGTILVDGGINKAQILWSEDASRVLARAVSQNLATERGIWEGLPDNGYSVAEFVQLTAASLRCSVNTVSIQHENLERELPSYFEDEPLWRETALQKSPANLFSRLGIDATHPKDWLARLPPPVGNADSTRPAELTLMRRYS